MNSSAYYGWKSKTCEGCMFRVESECRRFPPVIESEFDVTTIYAMTSYPAVEFAIGKTDERDYMPACAEYQSEES